MVGLLHHTSQSLTRTVLSGRPTPPHVPILNNSFLTYLLVYIYSTHWRHFQLPSVFVYFLSIESIYFRERKLHGSRKIRDKKSREPVPLTGQQILLSDYLHFSFFKLKQLHTFVIFERNYFNSLQYTYLPVA